MTITIRVKRILAATFVTVFLAANAFQIDAVVNDQHISEAMLLNFKIIKGTPITWPDGTFKGCIAGGSGCWIMTTSLGEVTLSGEGLNLQ